MKGWSIASPILFAVATASNDMSAGQIEILRDIVGTLTKYNVGDCRRFIHQGRQELCR